VINNSATPRLRSAFNRRLAATVAFAASLFAVPLAAQAEIVYRDLTGVPLANTAEGDFYLYLAAPSAAASVSSTDEGADFKFFSDVASFFGDEIHMAAVSGIGSNLVFTNVYVGDVIEAEGAGTSSYRLTIAETNPESDIFSPNSSGYIGFEFYLESGIHYGWAELAITDTGAPFIQLNRFAYNTEAGEGIAVGAIPEPSTMGLVAVAGLSLFPFIRRKRLVEHTE